MTSDDNATKRRNDMCEDNLMLVNAVKKYQCLYNFSIPEYMKKDDTDTAWSEVASYMRQTVSECKEKWRNLRYSFLRSLKPHPDGSAKKKYYLHKEMEFLLPFMKTRFDGVLAPQYEDESDDETNTDINNVEEAIVTLTEEPENHLDYCTLEFQNTEPIIKRRKTSQKSSKDYGNTECPRKMFLLGLLPEINSLSEVQMRAFRRKVFKLIDDVSQNDGQSINTGDNNNRNKLHGPSNSKQAQISTEEREFITTVKSEPL